MHLVLHSNTERHWVNTGWCFFRSRVHGETQQCNGTDGLEVPSFWLKFGLPLIWWNRAWYLWRWWSITMFNLRFVPSTQMHTGHKPWKKLKLQWRNRKLHTFRQTRARDNEIKWNHEWCLVKRPSGSHRGWQLDPDGRVAIVGYKKNPASCHRRGGKRHHAGWRHRCGMGALLPGDLAVTEARRTRESGSCFDCGVSSRVLVRSYMGRVGVKQKLFLQNFATPRQRRYGNTKQYQSRKRFR